MFYLEQQLNRLSEISPGIFICSQEGVTDENVSDHCITHVINLACIEDKLTNRCSMLHVPIDDNATSNIQSLFEQTNKFIHAALDQGGNVLVHCEKGISRSPTIVCAYLIWKAHQENKEVNWEEQLTFIRSKRSIVTPNQGFCEQLAAYASQLNSQLAALHIKPSR